MDAWAMGLQYLPAATVRPVSAAWAVVAAPVPGIAQTVKAHPVSSPASGPMAGVPVAAGQSLVTAAPMGLLPVAAVVGPG